MIRVRWLRATTPGGSRAARAAGAAAGDGALRRRSAAGVGSSDSGPVLQRRPPGADGVGEHPRDAVVRERRQLALAVGSQRSARRCCGSRRASAVAGTSSVGPSAGVLSTNSWTRRSKAADRGRRASRARRGPPASVSTNSSRPASGSRCSALGELAQGRRTRRWSSHRRRRSAASYGQQALGGGAVGGQQAVLLVLELLVEGRAGDAGLGADLGDADALRALFARQLDDGVDQPLTLAAPLGAPGRSCAGLPSAGRMLREVG